MSTILAALRFYQSKGLGDPDNRPLDIHDIATDGDCISLDEHGIDDLCEAINFCDDEPTAEVGSSTNLIAPVNDKSDRYASIGEMEQAAKALIHPYDDVREFEFFSNLLKFIRRLD